MPCFAPIGVVDLTCICCPCTTTDGEVIGTACAGPFVSQQLLDGENCSLIICFKEVRMSALGGRADPGGSAPLG